MFKELAAAVFGIHHSVFLPLRVGHWTDWRNRFMPVILNPHLENTRFPGGRQAVNLQDFCRFFLHCSVRQGKPRPTMKPPTPKQPNDHPPERASVAARTRLKAGGFSCQLRNGTRNVRKISFWQNQHESTIRITYATNHTSRLHQRITDSDGRSHAANQQRKGNHRRPPRDSRRRRRPSNRRPRQRLPARSLSTP